MDDPESEDDALILGADQVIPDEFVEGVAGFGEWDRLGLGRIRHRREFSGYNRGWLGCTGSGGGPGLLCDGFGSLVVRIVFRFQRVTGPALAVFFVPSGIAPCRDVPACAPVVLNRQRMYSYRFRKVQPGLLALRM